MIPAAAPVVIAPIPDPMLAPVEVPVLAPVVAPELAPGLGPVLGPELGPDLGPELGPDLGPELGPDLGPELAPMDEFPVDAPGPGPMEMPAMIPEELPVDAPEQMPGPAPLDIDPDMLPVEAPAPVPLPVPAPAPVADVGFDRIVPGPDGRYKVCVNGNSEQWGLWDIFRPCGIRVFADGRVELAEWFGGFDGYPAVDPADGHETCFNSAVAEMFDVPLCDFTKTTDGIDDYGDEIDAVECQENDDGSQCVCAADEKAASLKSQRGWKGNVGIKIFLETLRERADPINYDFPQDEEIADAGGRADNVALVQNEFEKMITVEQC